MLSLLVVVLDNTVLNVALRTIADPEHGLGTTQAQLEWAINAYTRVLAGLLFTAGVLGDRWGRRRVLLIGLVFFALASLASAYAQTPAQLIAARAAMGIGGAAVLPSTLSIIAAVFDPRERGRAIGVWASAVGLAVAIGPVLGGTLLENFWWGSVFLINVPIIAVGTVLIALVVPESRNPSPGRLDLLGVLLSIAGLVTLVYGIIDGGEHGFGRPRVWAAIAVGVALLGLFVRLERRSDHPSLNVQLFRDARFSAAVAATGLVFFAGFGTLFFLSFYLQLVRGLSPLDAGLMLTPFAAAQLIFAPRSATMVRRHGPRAVCAVGLALVTVALAGYAFVGLATPLWVLLALTFVQGSGMANVVPPTTESILSALPPQEAGVGSAVSNIFRQVGGALGVAVLGSVLAAFYRRGITGSLDGLPPAAQAEAGESISGAYGVAAKLGQAGPALIESANSAFVSAMHWAAGASAVVAAGGVAVVLAYLPRRSHPRHDHGPTPEDQVASEPPTRGHRSVGDVRRWRRRPARLRRARTAANRRHGATGGDGGRTRR